MSALSLRLPDSIHKHIKEIANKEGVSINQFISSAVAEKISAILTEDYLGRRAKRAKKADFRRILDKVPDRKPLHGDEL
ncbi:MAG: CopG family transcriptional regulator [Thermodesulfovibrio sp. RBG_19FT_COMBO_42_12]|nr:MAG: CopG family transcriptional regulator [Thermodesulfovibrio sp. RBG_19FT_COMBO_42_12]